MLRCGERGAGFRRDQVHVGAISPVARPGIGCAWKIYAYISLYIHVGRTPVRNVTLVTVLVVLYSTYCCSVYCSVYCSLHTAVAYVYCSVNCTVVCTVAHTVVYTVVHTVVHTVVYTVVYILP